MGSPRPSSRFGCRPATAEASASSGRICRPVSPRPVGPAAAAARSRSGRASGSARQTFTATAPNPGHGPPRLLQASGGNGRGATRVRAMSGSKSVAMHMSDGLINAPASVLFGAIAVLGVAIAARAARRSLDDRTAPMAGLVAAFVFATQMLNFPILPGVSGHLLGGALAAMLVGPFVGALCVGIVLVVQALVFADGGLTALGANITNMALICTAAGFLVALALRRVAARGRAGLVAVAFAAAFCGT